MTFTDSTKKIWLHTRKCDDCGKSEQFPYVPSRKRKNAPAGLPTFRDARQQADKWRDKHVCESAYVPA